MAEEKPGWMKVMEDGSVQVSLSKPMEVNGAKISYLVMREPTLDDQIVSNETRGSDAIKELTLFSNLCTVAASDMRKIAYRDYMRLQAAFGNFID